jgi:hypothetical protein
MIETTGGATLTERDLIKWANENWTHRLIAWGAIVVTVSLLVQIIATILLARIA